MLIFNIVNIMIMIMNNWKMFPDCIRLKSGDMQDNSFVHLSNSNQIVAD